MSSARLSMIICLYSAARVGFLARDEARADVREVGAERLRGEDRAAAGDGLSRLLFR